MKAETLKELVNNSELPQLQKNVINGFIDRANDNEKRNQEDIEIIKQVANEKQLSEVIISTDEVKFYAVSGKDEWDIKYPFRSIYKNKEGNWKRINTVSPNLDLAYLNYLQYKYLDTNSQFTKFAIKMLEINL